MHPAVGAVAGRSTNRMMNRRVFVTGLGAVLARFNELKKELKV
jgi:hypothetical protein